MSVKAKFWTAMAVGVGSFAVCMYTQDLIVAIVAVLVETGAFISALRYRNC